MMALLRTLLSLLLMVTAIPALAQGAGDVATRLDGAASELGLVDGALDTKL